jgi:uncharacterized protein (DUF488 family)
MRPKRSGRVLATDGPVVLTLGHSRHGIAGFVALAKSHGIDTVIDVRGQPYSRFNPQFNRERFAASLEDAGIGYVWEGERLPGRPRDRKLHTTDGAVDWAALRAAPGFAAGIDAVLERAAAGRIALVCAEEDPLRCHRRFLLTPPLIERGARVVHVRGDGRAETEADVAARQKGAATPQLDLFG